MNRKMLMSWIVAATLVALLGIAAIVAGRSAQVGALPETTVTEWQEYVELVKRGERTPSLPQIITLTDAALAHNAYARAMAELIQGIGVAVTVLGVLLAADLMRIRRRRDEAGPPG